MPGFAIPDGAFAGWLHYCVFDPLVGLGIVLDAKQQQVPHLLCVPCAAVSRIHRPTLEARTPSHYNTSLHLHCACRSCLFLTLFAGPMGFLAYLVLRTATLTLRKQPVPPPPKGFKWA